MKRLLTIFLCLLAGWLVYRGWPEYGSGYSEQQRQLWNERRMLYPVPWVVNNISLETNRSDHHYVVSYLTGREPDGIAGWLKEKTEREKGIVRELEGNRDRLSPEYEVVPPVKVDVSRLPLEGLTKYETAERALAGDGDACLKMVQYLCGWHLYSVSSWRKKYEVERWLDRAVALNRPGVEFLKETFKRTWTLEKASRMRKSNFFVTSGNPPAQIPGYADFAGRLKKGDYILYETLRSVSLVDDVEKERFLIHDALLKKAKRGETAAQKNLAALCFNMNQKRYDYWRDFVFRHLSGEMAGQQKKWKKNLIWLPDSWKNSIVSGLFTCGIIDANRASAMKCYREAAGYAQKAARKGDMTGMYLWLRYGITSMNRFTAEEWKEIFTYSRLLFESGYVPYISGIEESRDKSIESSIGALDDAVLRSFYSPASYERLWKQEYLFSRGEAKENCSLWEELIKRNDLEETRKIIRFLCLTGKSDDVVKNLTGKDFSAGGILGSVSKEVQTCLLEQVERWVEEGDVYAMYMLAGIYENGITVPSDLGRAYALYQQTLQKSGEHSFFEVLVGARNGEAGDYRGMKLKDAACFKRAEMVLKYPHFPGRNEQEVCRQVFDLMAEIADDSIKKDDNSIEKEYVKYCLRQFYERGIGGPENREKVLELYEKSTFSYGKDVGIK